MFEVSIQTLFTCFTPMNLVPRELCYPSNTSKDLSDKLKSAVLSELSFLYKLAAGCLESKTFETNYRENNEY